jgi:hypothetical protein
LRRSAEHPLSHSQSTLYPAIGRYIGHAGTGVPPRR